MVMDTHIYMDIDIDMYIRGKNAGKLDAKTEAALKEKSEGKTPPPKKKEEDTPSLNLQVRKNLFL